MATPFKEGLGPKAIERIARVLSAVEPSFDAKSFERDAKRGLGDLELKQRVDHVIAALATHLPSPLPRALDVLERAAASWEAGDPKDPLRGFAAWPLIDFVGRHGLGHFDRSLEALRRLTPLFSAEFAIRPFLIEDAERALVHLRRWALDPSEHVRRLVSEGTRPRLPWGQRLRRFQAEPALGLELLELLKDDPSLYVRRSVANHLNDVAKDHPELVVATLERWREGASPERAWILRHAARTLVKQGHPSALALHGVDAQAQVDAGRVRLEPKRVELGGAITWELLLTSRASAPARVVVDYVVHHQKADGSLRPKVFKGTKLTLGPGEARVVRKTHRFTEVTVRRYHPGLHELEVLVNGCTAGRARFELVSSASPTQPGEAAPTRRAAGRRSGS